jgi:hypothetical protein
MLAAFAQHDAGVLKNPSYAGNYVFGRYQYRREINVDGEVRKRMQAVAMRESQNGHPT